MRKSGPKSPGNKLTKSTHRSANYVTKAMTKATRQMMREGADEAASTITKSIMKRNKTSRSGGKKTRL